MGNMDNIKKENEQLKEENRKLKSLVRDILHHAEYIQYAVAKAKITDDDK